MKLLLRRKFKGETYTIGDLFIDGVFFCNTLEDKVRPLPQSCPNTSKGISCKCKEKVYSQTAIPEGIYKVTMQMSLSKEKEIPDIPSDPNFERFGSSEYTIAFVDEVSEILEKTIEVLFSRLRWRIHETFKTSRMLMTTNPTVSWVRSHFVQDENGEKVSLSEGEVYVPFSVYDNLNIAFRQIYELSNSHALVHIGIFT